MSSRDARTDARVIDPSGHQGTQTDAVNETRGTTLTQQAGSMCCLSLRDACISKEIHKRYQLLTL
jgi:hypothetical protein